MYKKGLSTVVTSLIIILLVLVAIGIVWIVVRGVVTEGAGEIESTVDCLNVNIDIVDVDNDRCDGTRCILNITRGMDDEDIEGVNIVVSSDAASYQGTETINSGQTKEVTINDDDNEMSNTDTVSKVAASAYFDDDGEKNYCAGADEYTVTS